MNKKIQKIISLLILISSTQARPILISSAQARPTGITLDSLKVGTVMQGQHVNVRWDKTDWNRNERVLLQHPTISDGLIVGKIEHIVWIENNTTPLTAAYCILYEKGKHGRNQSLTVTPNKMGQYLYPVLKPIVHN